MKWGEWKWDYVDVPRRVCKGNSLQMFYLQRLMSLKMVTELPLTKTSTKKVRLGNRGVVAVIYYNCRLIHRKFHNSSPTDYTWSLARVLTKRALTIYIKLKLFQRIVSLLKLFFLFDYVDFPRITAVFSLSQRKGDYLIYTFNKN